MRSVELAPRPARAVLTGSATESRQKEKSQTKREGRGGVPAVKIVDDSIIVEVRCFTCGLHANYVVNGKEPRREITTEGHKADNKGHDVWQRKVTLSYAETEKPEAKPDD